MAGCNISHRPACERGSVSFWDVWTAHEQKLRRLCISMCRGKADDAEDLLLASLTRACGTTGSMTARPWLTTGPG